MQADRGQDREDGHERGVIPRIAEEECAVHEGDVADSQRQDGRRRAGQGEGGHQADERESHGGEEVGVGVPDRENVPAR